MALSTYTKISETNPLNASNVCIDLRNQFHNIINKPEFALSSDIISETEDQMNAVQKTIRGIAGSNVFEQQVPVIIIDETTYVEDMLVIDGIYSIIMKLITFQLTRIVEHNLWTNLDEQNRAKILTQADFVIRDVQREIKNYYKDAAIKN